MSQNEAEMISPAQLGRMIGLSAEAVRRAVRRGRIDAVYFGTKIRFTPEQVQEIKTKGWPKATG